MNDCVSSFVWRKVDFNVGAVEFFEHDNYNGHRATVFLSEWVPYTVHNIAKWALQDNITSIRWNALNDRVALTVYENADGLGNKYDNIAGYTSQKEISNLKDIRFNDCISSFSWTPMSPKKEIVQPFPISMEGVSFTGGLVSQQTGTNDSSEKQSVQLTLTDTTSQTVTATTTDQFTTGIKIGVSQKTSGDVGVVKEEVSTSLEVSFQYQRTETKTTSDTKTVTINISQTASIPANCTYNATLTAQLGRIADKTYYTTATRWYDVAVTGSVADPVNNGWYKRDETVSLRVTGAVAVNWTIYVKATALK
jgi:hypothetical protein